MIIRNLSIASLVFIGLSFTMLACDGDTGSNLETQADSSFSSQSTDIMSSVGEELFLSSSGESKNVLGSSSSAQCYMAGMVGIAIWNKENLGIVCPNGVAYYNLDLHVLYQCDGSTPVEIEMPPCEIIGDTITVLDDDAMSSSETDLLKSSSSVAVSTAKYGSMQDSRDGKNYKTIVIGNKTWMAENLNFYKNLDGSIVLDSTFCYDDVLTNCEKYGRLYQEDEASKACPEGWRIPTEEEWDVMRNTVKAQFGVEDANAPLRAVGAWEDKILATNASGFSAVPAGYRNKSGQYDGEGNKAYFWGENGMLYYGWILSRQYELDKESMIRGYYAYSVRCVSSQP